MSIRQPSEAVLAVMDAAVADAMRGPTTPRRITDKVLEYLAAFHLAIGPELRDDVPRGFLPPPGRPAPLTDADRAGNLARLADATRRPRKEPTP